MKPDYRFLIVVGSLFAQLVSSSAAADASAAEALHAAYVTRLFALETRLAVRTSGIQLTSEEKTSLALLKTERERLCRRVKVSKQYVRKRLFDAGNRMERILVSALAALEKPLGMDYEILILARKRRSGS